MPARKERKQRMSPRVRRLRHEVRASLRKQGFRVEKDIILPPKRLTKARQRSLHKTAVEHLRAQKAKYLAPKEDELIEFIASGHEICPSAIEPQLVEVRPGTVHELLFRYTCLHWSVPVSSGYGRRLRFLVFDQQNGKLMGLFGLCDPVFAIGARDHWIGWDSETRRRRLRNVLDAFVLGSVPPYSFLLCGKLTAMLATSDEVRKTFRRRYGKGESIISSEPADGRLALVTTTSALGRSSMYNRIRFNDRLLYHPLGFTSGWGEFHFTNGLYSRLRQIADESSSPTAKQQDWGTGFRNRREVVRKALALLRFSSAYHNHGILREVYAAPLAENAREFLCGESDRLRWHHQTVAELYAAFKERWLLPRSIRDNRWSTFKHWRFRLWKNGKAKGS